MAALFAGRATASDGVQAYRDAVAAFNAAAASVERGDSPEQTAELLAKASASLNKANQTALTAAEKRVVAGTVLDELEHAYLRLSRATVRASVAQLDRWKNALPPPRDVPKLESITSSTPLAELRKLLKHEDRGVRMQAAQVLGQLGKGAEAALPELDEMAGDGNYFVANAARTAIMRIGTKAAMAKIIPNLSPYSTWPARGRAARDLWEFGPMAKEAIPALIRCFDYEGTVSASRSCAFCAAHALARIGPAALPALRDELKSERPERVEYSIVALCEMGAIARDELPVLRGLCTHKDGDIAEKARGAVSRIEAALKK